MSETVFDEATIASSGTSTGVFSKDGNVDEVPLLLEGDGSSSNLDFEVTGVDIDSTSGTPSAKLQSANSVTGLDSSTDDQFFTLTGLHGVEHVELTVTNNAATGTTFTLTQNDL